MRVAYIIGGLPFGGVENWLYDLCLEYKQNGLVQGRVFNVSGTGELLSAYIKAGIDVECLRPAGVEVLSTRRLSTAYKLRKALKLFAPDIIHTMHFSANYHGRLAALGLGIPIITHLHNIKREHKPFRRCADKALSLITARYLAVSRAVAELVQKDHNLAGKPVQTLYNSLDPARLNHEPLDLKSEFGLDGPAVIAVGRYVPQKNLHLLIRAIGILRDKGRELPLLLVGEGPERPRLEALRAELKLERHVALTGFRSDVPALLKAAHIFAMPSDYEGLPVAHLEAMTCGLPAVLSPHVPSLEIASEAVLVCDLEAGDIAGKIEMLLNDQELYAKLSIKAREIVELLNIVNYAADLYSIYENILKGASDSCERAEQEARGTKN